MFDAIPVEEVLSDIGLDFFYGKNSFTKKDAKRLEKLLLERLEKESDEYVEEHLLVVA
jgi:hypothetical protein